MKEGMLRVLAPNVRVGGLVLSRRIAVGGMGDVWIARDEASGGEVALKVLRATREERTKARERFKREAEYARQLTHPSVVRVFDLIEDTDGTLLLVMELLHGDSLDRCVGENGPLPAREAIAILAPILHALDHGHARGIVHRDVKPSNIFLSTATTPPGVVPKILDYGIAKMAAALAVTTKGRILGTPSYMSPEQIVGETVDGRSDVFSAGVVLYEVLTGFCPFQGQGNANALEAVLQQDVDPDPSIEPRLFLEIKRALRKRPDDRFASAADMARALAQAIGETERTLASVLEGPLVALRAQRAEAQRVETRD